MEWPPGHLREASIVFLLSNPWLLNQGLGMRQGESRVCGPRVVEGKCSWTLPSGCPTAFPKWVWQECAQTVSLLGILLQLRGRCWCFLAGSPTLLVLLQPWPAPLPIGLFFEKAVSGDRPPTCLKCAGFFLFSQLIYFNYYLRGLHFLALTLPLFF